MGQNVSLKESYMSISRYILVSTPIVIEMLGFLEKVSSFTGVTSTWTVSS